MSPYMKMVPLQVSVPERAKATLERQAKERGIALSLWIGQIFDMGFAAVCGREKSMPVSDGDLDAIVSAALLLRARERWDTATIAQSLGVSEPTVVRILDAWKQYRAGGDATRASVQTEARSPAPIDAGVMSLDDLLALKMQRRYRQILEILAKNPRSFVSVERLIDKLFGDDPDGGPDNAEGTVHTQVCRLRRDVLKPVGWTINVSRGDGYRLERLPA